MKKAKIPHFDIGLQAVHITYRLAGSIPKVMLEKYKARRDQSLQSTKLEVKEMSGQLGIEAFAKRKIEISS